jgi:CheY-like chemotaxis protein
MQKRILVVAQATEVVEAIPITLKLAGHKVALADCGLDAILWAEKARPDLILVDATLPDMDGSTIIRILRSLPSTTALATMLLDHRWQYAASASRSRRAEHDSLNSSELLRQVAVALTLCRAASQDAAPAHQSEAIDLDHDFPRPANSNLLRGLHERRR